MLAINDTNKTVMILRQQIAVTKDLQAKMNHFTHKEEKTKVQPSLSM